VGPSAGLDVRGRARTSIVKIHFFRDMTLCRSDGTSILRTTNPVTQQNRSVQSRRFRGREKMLSLSATQSDYDRLSYAVMQSNNAVLAGDRTHGVQPAVSQFY